jgi:hypothetical protein
MRIGPDVAVQLRWLPGQTAITVTWCVASFGLIGVVFHAPHLRSRSMRFLGLQLQRLAFSFVRKWC